MVTKNKQEWRNTHRATTVQCFFCGMVLKFRLTLSNHLLVLCAHELMLEDSRMMSASRFGQKTLKKHRKKVGGNMWEFGKNEGYLNFSKP